MHSKVYQKIIIVVLCILTIGCKKETTTPPPEITPSRKVYIICEGAYGNGNAALDYYDVDSNEYLTGIYQAVNQQSLGDVFQSMTRIGEYFFLCINNADKIIVINKSNLTIQTVINIPQPRYILPIHPQKAYVSSLYSNKIYIINPQTFKKTGEFSLPTKNAEEMLLYKNQAVVCSWDTANQSLYYIDVVENKLVKTINIKAQAPQSLVMDKDENLWITSGDVFRNINAALTKINPATGSVLQQFHFPENIEVIKPVLNAAKDSLYFIQVRYDGITENNGVFRMNINAQQVPSQPFIAAKPFQYFWAVGIAPGTGNIFISDPKNFNQKGAMQIYTPGGEQIKAFTTSVGPNGFYFDY